MTDIQSEDGRLTYEDGHLDHAADCCCCDCKNCCESMQAEYNELLFDFSSAACTGITGQLTQASYEANCAGGEVSPCSIILECVEDLGNRRANFTITVHMENSGGCDFTGTFTAEGDCFPPDVTFTFDSGADCCGNVTIRFYAPDCPDPCYCRCDNHCMPEDLVLTATNDAGCTGVGSEPVAMTCTGTCTWEGSGCFDLGASCCYDFEITAGEHNCTGDFTLTIRSGGVEIWSGVDNCAESLCYPTSLVWGPIELPCCGGGTVMITATLPP